MRYLVDSRKKKKEEEAKRLYSAYEKPKIMATNRQFCRFNNGQSVSTGTIDQSGLTTREIPQGGMCLSAFVLLGETGKPKSVLMGRLNPEAPWDHIGALDKARVEIHSKGWMLPSSHLMIHESPQEAAARIAREQLGFQYLNLSEPKVVSEVYATRFGGSSKHWDFEFIFLGTLDRNSVKKTDAWKDLEFIDLVTVDPSSIARLHGDILESAGLKARAGNSNTS